MAQPSDRRENGAPTQGAPTQTGLANDARAARLQQRQALHEFAIDTPLQASSQAPAASSQASAWTPAAAACRHLGPHRRAFSARELSLANERYRAWKAGHAQGIAFALAIKGKRLAGLRCSIIVAPGIRRPTAPKPTHLLSLLRHLLQDSMRT